MRLRKYKFEARHNNGGWENITPIICTKQSLSTVHYTKNIKNLKKIGVRLVVRF
jgi:hypothetical protein